jgi:hypothetical protein
MFFVCAPKAREVMREDCGAHGKLTLSDRKTGWLDKVRATLILLNIQGTHKQEACTILTAEGQREKPYFTIAVLQFNPN